MAASGKKSKAEQFLADMIRCGESNLLGSG